MKNDRPGELDMNINTRKLKVMTLMLTMISAASFAVNLSNNGYGEAIILPYYTVNNDLNTLITINNSNDQGKAIKINFREGKQGVAVLSFNLYLAPQDIWAAALVSVQSTQMNHQGEDSAAILFNDTSCAPYLFSGQEFLPFAIDTVSPDTDLVRSRDGYIEIFEMGELDPNSGLGLALNDSPNLPRDCEQILTAHENGIWNESIGGDLTEQILPVAGGLSATVSIIDVAEGVLFSMDGVTFENFYREDIQPHTAPGIFNTPSLADASNSSIFVNQGEIIESEWTFGYQAVSALLMKNKVSHFYDLNPHVAGKTESVFTFPTKRFYYDQSGFPLAPFTAQYEVGEGACENTTLSVKDRESVDNYCELVPLDLQTCGGGGTGTLPPFDPNPFKFCYATSMLEFKLENSPINDRSDILGAANRFTVPAFDSGKVDIELSQSVDSLVSQTTQSVTTFTGLPFIATNFQKYTNAAAAPGLLAQYGGTNEIKYTRKVD